MAYQLVLAEPGPSTAFLGEITQWERLVASWKIDGPAQITTQIEGRHPLAGDVDELAVDLILFRDGLRISRCRVVAGDDTIGENTYALALGAVDYRGMLNRRFMRYSDVLAYENVAQATLAWQLIQLTQARPGGNLGITQGLSPVGTNRDRHYAGGQSIIDAVENLGRVINGFEWDIDAFLKLNVWTPTRGSDKGVILDVGGSVATLRRATKAENFSNALIVTGSNLDPIYSDDPAVASEPKGRWENVFSFPDITVQETLTERAGWLLARHSAAPQAYIVTLRAGFWEGPTQLWIGDTVRLIVDVGRLQVSASMRVNDFRLTLDPSGAETIELSLIEGHVG